MLFDLSSPGRRTSSASSTACWRCSSWSASSASASAASSARGIVDSLTGGGGDGDTAEQFEEQIDDAEARPRPTPPTRRRLRRLAERYLSGQVQLDVDEATGAPVLTEEARGEFEAAIDAWTRYLETNPHGRTWPRRTSPPGIHLLGDAEGAADTQEILAEDNPSAGTYSTLANFAYADFDFKRGDERVQRAVEEASLQQKKTVEKQLDQLREAYVKEEKRIEKLLDGGGAEAGLQSPFGGLDQGGEVPPTSP